MSLLSQNLQDDIDVKKLLLEDQKLQQDFEAAVSTCLDCYRKGGKLLFAGNGGSAADAQHLAAELSGRYFIDREPLYAEALHVNTSYLTAVANDYSYDEIYARLVRGMADEGDVLIVLSTSGNSANILAAAQAAQDKKSKVIGLTGQTGGQLAALCDLCLCVPSKITPLIQQAHMVLGHTLCQEIETTLFT